MTPPSPWKTPNEVMQLHKLKKRMKALQQRMKAPLSSTSEEAPTQENVHLDFSRILNGDKRKNPFSKNNTEQSKRIKLDIPPPEESNDKTLFALLKLPAKVAEKPETEVDTEKLSTFSNLLQKYNADHSIEPPIVEKKYKHLTIDWALKTKLRLMSPKPFAWTAMLKASEEASGITGFVRCVDTGGSPTLDTSPRARFHQSCLYWQHPQLPWLTLFPRARRVAAAGVLAGNEEVKAALLRDWTESFRSLFQLVRARHCPYFYVCANTFTCLFRAAGLGGGELSALLGPTTRGLRHALRQEDVEFTMPLRPDQKKKLNSSEEESRQNSSFDSCYDTMEGEGEASGDDEDPDQFLSQLGLETETIRKINNAQARLTHATESSVDSAAASLVAARGADAQALFNFLLNCRSAVGAGGPLAGVPPTLLAPVAFHGGTLQSLKVRENVIHSDSKKYYSIELRGPVLPTALHSLFAVLTATSAAPFSATFAHHAPTLAFTWAARCLLKGANEVYKPIWFAYELMESFLLAVYTSKNNINTEEVRENVIHSDSKKYYSIELRGPVLPTALHSLFAVLTATSAAPFSATFAHHAPTLAFTWAARSLLKDEAAKENEPNQFTKAFNKENLSDCGMSEEMLQHFCSPDPSLLKTLDSVKYNTEDDTYTW